MVIRNRDRESGQALVLVALSMAILMGFMALAIDVGLLFRTRRNLQIAADAASTAAGLNYLYYGNVNTAKAAGVAAAAANGVTITASDIHTPPLSGPSHSTTAGAYFEVIPQLAVGTNFMGVTTHSRTFTVMARAVAGTPAVGQDCIYITGSGADVLDMQGSSATISANGCGIFVTSSDPAAVQSKGGPNVTAAFFDVVGGYSGNGQGIGPTTPTTGAPAMSDPFGNLTGPNGNPNSTDCPTGASGNTVTANTVTSSTTLPVSNGITCFSSANVTLSAGITLPGGRIYVFENGVTIGGTMTVGSSTNGATLDIYSGTFNQGNSALTIYAPTSGTYNAIAIMQPQSNGTTLQVQSGSGSQVLDGWIYAPGAEVYLQDHGGGITASGIVASKMKIKASTVTIPTNYNSVHPTTTPLRAVTLVE
jgi:Flp pilus assembly protein TadG